MKIFILKCIDFILLALIISCSAGVKDKNSVLSNTEKKDLTLKTKKQLIGIKSIELETVNGIKEDLSEQSNLKSKYFTLKVCVNFINRSKEVGVRNVDLDGKNIQTDTEGCLRWDHEISINHTDKNKCRIFNKTIKFSEKTYKELQYSIDYLNDTISDLEQSKGCLRGDEGLLQEEKISPIYIKDIRVSPGNIMSEMRGDVRDIEHSTQIQTCLYTGLTGKPVVNARLRITATNLETKMISPIIDKNHNLKTGVDGCFSADFSSSFQQYQYTHWMEVSLKFEVLSGTLKDSILVRSIYINPWEYVSKDKYGIGEQGREPMEKVLKHDYARLHLDGVMYIQIGNDTNNMKVNDYLGLTVYKKYQVVLNPYIDREHSYSGKRVISRLFNKGRFKFSMIILAPKNADLEIDKNNFQNFELVTGVEKIVHIENGVINETVSIPFKMTDLPRLALRTMSIMKIEPIDDIGLKGTIVSGFFKARIAWIKTNVFQENDLKIPAYIDKVWKNIVEGKDKSDISLEEVDSKCSIEKGLEHKECEKGLTEILETDIDEHTIAYRHFVNETFKHLSNKLEKDKEDTPEDFSAKEIFTNHLKKLYDKIDIETTETAKKKMDINITSKDFDKLLPPNRTHSLITYNMAEELCRYGFTKDGKTKEILWGLIKMDVSYDRCLKDPGNFFAIKPVRHVKKVKSIGKSHSNNFTINIGEAYAVSKGEENNHAETVAWFIAGDLGGKMDVPFIGKVPVVGDMLNKFFGLGFKAGRSYNISDSHSKRKGFSVSENLGASQSLGIEQFVVDLNLTTERCFIVTSKDFINAALAAQRAPTDRLTAKPIEDLTPEEHKYYFPKKNFNITLYICDKKLKEEQFTESWFFIQNQVGAVFVVDGDGPDERKLLKVIRGSQSYRELHEALRDTAEKSLLMDNIGNETPADILIANWGHLLGNKLSEEDTAKFLLHNVEGSFPGTIEGSGAQKY